MDPQDGQVLMVNGQRLKPVITHYIDTGLIESIDLVDSVYYDKWMGSYLAEDIKFSA